MNNIKDYFDKIYNETYNNVLKYIISKTDNLSYVEDIIQNVYLSFYNIIFKKGLNYLETPEAYLIKSAKSEIFKYYTLKNKIKFLFNLQEEDNLSLIDNIPAKLDIETTILNQINIEEIWKFIAKEDLITQKIMALYFQNDMKIKEIASLLNLKEANVKNHLYRSIEKIKKHFGGVTNA